MHENLTCWRCGAPLRKEIQRPFPRLEKCPACEVDVHVCRMCRHYAPRYTQKCDHELAEPAREVDVANFRHYFKPSPHAFDGPEKQEESSAQDALSDLFGKDSGEPAERSPATEDPTASLNALFGEGAGNGSDEQR